MGQRDASDERGAVLALVGITIVIILVCGAIAVDLSVLDRRGQTLQNTADAAALAGVAEWTESQDQVAATEVVEEVIAQNGLVLGEDVTFQVVFPDAFEVEVGLVDADPDVFLGGLVGFGGDLARDATARFALCDNGCVGLETIAEPGGEFEALGTGDGFTPILIGQRLYAVNHHQTEMACVDRVSKSACWPEGGRDLFSPDRLTNNVTHAHVVNDRIYYVGHSQTNSNNKEPTSGNIAIGCFDTVTDTACPIGPTIPDEGHAILAGTQDNLYLFTGARKVHCFTAPALTRCTGWTASGKDTAMSALSNSDWELKNVRNFSSSNIQLGSRIYVVISREEPGTEDYEGTWLHCWDTDDDDPCDNFGTVQILPGTNGSNFNVGRQFFYRNAAGVALGICVTGRQEVECFDLDDASYEPGYTNAMWDTVGEIASLNRSWWFVGQHTYHEPSNRLFILGSWRRHTTYCHDFNTDSYCGSVFNTTAYGDAGTYGYATEGNCLIGYGDQAIFFTLRPDLSGECDTSEAKFTIEPCNCGGQNVWPPLEAANLDGVGRFDARIRSEDGAFLYPADGSWINLLTDDLDLSSIPLTESKIIVEVQVEAIDGFDPWDDDAWPSVAIGELDKTPKLVE